MSFIKRSIISILLLITGLFCAAPVIAVSPRPKVVLVVADYLTLSDIVDSKLPGIHRMVSEGGVGLICPGATSVKSVGKDYISISAGGSCWAGSDVYKAYSSFETLVDEPDSAGTIFLRRTGETRIPDVVHLGLPYIERVNKEKIIRALPGTLAKILEQNGKKTAVFGNADALDKQRRHAVVIAATTAGSVDFGDVSKNLLRREPLSATGFVTDSDKLAAAVNNTLSQADFVVVDFGDTSRVELNRSRFSDLAYTKHRKESMQNLDRLLSKILDGPGGNATVILASLRPQIPKPRTTSRLAPIIIRKPNGTHGCLISSTTRTQGLVSGLDITPTIIAELGLKRYRSITGAPINVVSSSQEQVKWLDNLVVLNRDTVWSVLGILAGIGIFAITASCIAIVRGRGTNGVIGIVLRSLLLTAMAAPIAMFLATPGTPTVAQYTHRLLIWVVVLVIASFVSGSLLKRMLGMRVKYIPGALPMIALALISTIIIFIEAFRGGELLKFALPSTADFRGFRFYGVGNEYMGVWLGTAIVSILWLRECFPGWSTKRSSRIFMVLLMTMFVLAIGISQFGANAGGVMAAVVGLGVVYISGVKQNFNARHVIAFVFAGIAMVFCFGLLDILTSNNSPSHIGTATLAGSNGGYNLLLATVARKLAMNLRLMATPQSVVTMIAGIPFFILCFSSFGKKVNDLIASRPAFRSGIMASLVAAGAAFLFNDSGIVAGALVFSFVVLAIVYSLMDNQCKAVGISSCQD